MRGYRMWFLVCIGIPLLIGCADRSDVPDYYLAHSPMSVEGMSDISVANTPILSWSAEEVALLRSMWLASLPLPPTDPSNRVSGNRQAAAMGHRLFFDFRFSANGQVACASCHVPELSFTDGFERGFGTRRTQRNTSTLLGVAYSPWLLWDGHKDSLWSQALEPLEHPDEHGTTRLHVVHLIYEDQTYHAQYEALFGPLPDVLQDFDRFPDSGGPVDFGPYRASWDAMTEADQAIVTEIFVNVGKAIAAYERLLIPGPSRFDAYVQALLSGDEQTASTLLTQDEVAGLRLFIGEADCVRCHQGPLMSDFAFHNTGVPFREGNAKDQGRLQGQAVVQTDIFNCLGPYSDTEPTDCLLANFIAQPDSSRYSFKTPTLRNISDTGPYMHGGQFDTLTDVLRHYNNAPQAPLGQSDIKPLSLSDQELRQLVDFLAVLQAPLATPIELLQPVR
ncbi:MAG: cytochrome c peroxidase [Chloroflexota bacterium]